MIDPNEDLDPYGTPQQDLDFSKGLFDVAEWMTHHHYQDEGIEWMLARARAYRDRGLARLEEEKA